MTKDELEKIMTRRPVKFRAWSKKDGGWIDPETLIIFSNGEVGTYDPGCWDGGVTTHDDFVGEHVLFLMQFTGLLDNNGKEIWEGDIVRARASTWLRDYRAVAPVSFDHGCFYPLGTGDWNITSEEWEVIGNVWENPELLEEP